jgi:hypothetical protein
MVFLTHYVEIYVSSLQNKLQTSLGNYLHKLFQKLVFLDLHHIIAQFLIKAGAASCTLSLCL